MSSRRIPRRPSSIVPSIVIAIAATLGGCATTASRSSGEAAQNDPFESLNRDIFAVNTAIDHAVIRPVAKAYRAALPEVLRDHIRAIIDNMHEPLVFLNDVLQGRGEAAGISYHRFIINTTLGLGGFYDRAAEFGLTRQSGDFGQTLYAWGVEDGPYLMLPLLGPSNFRDVVGLGVDAYASPVGHIGADLTRRRVSLSTGVVDGVGTRSRNIEALDSIEENSLEEERRLAYVGLTRARERLTLLHSASRALYGGRNYNLPSRFLDELPTEHVERERLAPATWSARSCGPGASGGSSSTSTTSCARSSRWCATRRRSSR